jgi:hypothetical protein
VKQIAELDAAVGEDSLVDALKIKLTDEKAKNIEKLNGEK